MQLIARGMPRRWKYSVNTGDPIALAAFTIVSRSSGSRSSCHLGLSVRNNYSSDWNVQVGFWSYFNLTLCFILILERYTCLKWEEIRWYHKEGFTLDFVSKREDSALTVCEFPSKMTVLVSCNQSISFLAEFITVLEIDIFSLQRSLGTCRTTKIRENLNLT